MFRSTIIASLAFVGVFLQSAHAGISYSYVSDSISYTVSPGSLTVNIYLLEQLTDGSASLIVHDGGLTTFGVRVDRKIGDTGSSLLSFESNAKNLWPKYVDASSTINPASAFFGGSAFTTLNTATDVFPDSQRKILLGSVQIEAKSGTTHFSFAKHPPPTIGGFTATAGVRLENAILAVAGAAANRFCLGLDKASGRGRQDFKGSAESVRPKRDDLVRWRAPRTGIGVSNLKEIGSAGSPVAVMKPAAHRDRDDFPFFRRLDDARSRAIVIQGLVAA